MNADHVLTLFAEANPVPDVDVVRRELGRSTVDLAALESRSGIMHTEQLEHVEEVTPERRLRPAWVFALAFLLAIVVVGGGVLLMRGGEEPAVVDQPPSTLMPTTNAVAPTTGAAPTTQATQPTTVSPALPPLSEGWEVVASGDDLPRTVGYVEGIGFVAVGSGEAEVTNVAVSADGTEWVTGDGSTMSADAAFLAGVVPGGPGALAYGWTCEGECGGRLPQEPALYGSVDGLTWDRIEHDAFVGCGTRSAECYSGISHIAVADDGSLLATGHDARLDGTQASVTWTSRNGIDWVRHEVDLALFVPEEWTLFSESIEHPVYAGERWIGFLWSYYFPPDAEFEVGQTIVVESADGATWTVADTGDEFADALVWDAVATPHGVVAVDMGTTWASSDGLVWERSSMPGDGDYRFLVTLDGGVVAIGDAWEIPGAALSFSPESGRWQQIDGVSGLGAAIVESASSSPERIVLMGSQHIGGELFTDDAVFVGAIFRWEE